jgi:glycosyltransferase involved in cell wall biosynthesis
MTPTVALVIPAFRPPALLPALLRDIVALDEPRILQAIVVVDDGSEASFAPTFNAAAIASGVTIVRRNANGGQGAALKSGIGHALAQFPDLAGVVTADADGQHAPEDIVRIARAFAARPDAVLLGIRTFGASVPLRSRLGNVLTQHLVALTAGLRVADTQTGLRGWPRRGCERNLGNEANGFEYNLATLLAAAAAGDPIVQMPIRTIYEPGNPSSHFRPLRDSLRIYRVLLAHALHRRS